jgi:hypothetical protein
MQSASALDGLEETRGYNRRWIPEPVHPGVTDAGALELSERGVLMKPGVFNLAVACLLAAAGPLHASRDDFDDDPALNSDWEVYQPLADSGVKLEHEDGLFRAIFPAGIVLDHWISPWDNATQLRRADMPEDFIMETRLHFAGSGDPLSPTWPPADQAYQAALMVYFSRFDVFYWGPYRGTNLMLERSGINWICQFNPNLQDVSLQVTKVGTTYSFSWRETDDLPWDLVCNQEATETPMFVGYIFKTWNPAITEQETFEFDYFSLQSEEAPEDCTNGIDDDGDTKIDCQDEDCAAHPSCIGPKFLRGDPNDDGSTNITDGIYVLNYLFLSGLEPTCRESADANDDGGVNITDGIYLLNYLFLSGPEPVDPGPAGMGLPCGPDREGSPQDLGCDSYTKC